MMIRELAKETGTSVQTLRFYERLGLMPKPARTESGYRLYGSGDLRRVALIRQAKSLGFSLDEIKRILRLRQQGSCPCGEVVRMLEGIHAKQKNRSVICNGFAENLQVRSMTGNIPVTKRFPAT